MNTPEPAVGDVLFSGHLWAIWHDGKLTDVGRDAKSVQDALLQRMGCDWPKAYELGFRLVRVAPTYAINAVLVEHC